MQKMSNIERILSMGIGRSGLGFEEESRVVAETIKELQAYRVTGLTPTMVKDLIESCKKHEKNALENAHIVDEYSAIGTVDQCREAVERMKPKKPIEQAKAKDGETYVGMVGRCPACGSMVDWTNLCCDECFQRLDWSE